MPNTRGSPNPNIPPEEGLKKKKPPACDSCKARRVLCHPTTDGTPCPRCIEKGTKCTTTPVTRGRPPKKHLGVVPATPPSASESEPLSSTGSPYDSIGLLPPQESTRLLELSPELVHHLFECFAHLPQYSHPMFRGNILRKALSSVSWKIHQLTPQQRVLAHCVVALSASISYDHAILGIGPQPASFADRSVFMQGADLRSYGVRRAPMYRALCAQALRLACEAGILLEPSEDNAASCFFMQFLEIEKEATSRPWAVAYFSHVRAIAASWNDTNVDPLHAVMWNSFLMLEALETIGSRHPVLISHNDQLLISGNEPLPLQNLFETVQTTMRTAKLQPHTVFRIMPSVFFHITRLCRQLSEAIIGDFARRQPLNETAVTEFLSELTLLHSIRCLVFPPDEPNTASADPLFQGSPQTRSTHLHLRASAGTMVFSRTTMLLALHRELAHRAARAPTTMGQVAWAAERVELLRRQVRELAFFAVEEIAHTLLVPSLPHLTHAYRGALVACAQFCLDEAEPERVGVIEAFAGALKLVGYSWTPPAGLVERLEAYVDTHRVAPLQLFEISTWRDMFPAPLASDLMELFAMPLGQPEPEGL
ncbi:hypothetical protein B0H17DRAFT_1040129 [Mycena rosella]|uniref:Zn(2)-C6 fungal-type domain-containing protein n=1 Tax=Mycena rosella TaxID=1033263 RepID=A0AAD7GRU7_MYCRO|nr:hypothetical protein B0H17DRAFT_1040129 [Mycena rosella]